MRFSPLLPVLAFSLVSPLLTSCGGNKGELAPQAGALTGSNPAAAAQLERAKNFERAGNRKAAAKAYRSLFKEYPYSTEGSLARYNFAKLQQADGELIDAFDAYQAFISRHPTHPNYSDAITQQAVVANAAADGNITNNFLGLKTKIDPVRTEEMLRSVIGNAPRSAAASTAQFKIGDMWQSRGDAKRAITAFREMVSEYPTAPNASEAQYRIGMILIRQSEAGNQDTANLQAARKAFLDYQTAYPNGPRSAEVRQQLASLATQDVANSLKIAKFYEKKGQLDSARFYYREVLRQASGGPLRAEAQRRLSAIGGN